MGTDETVVFARHSDRQLRELRETYPLLVIPAQVGIQLPIAKQQTEARRKTPRNRVLRGRREIDLGLPRGDVFTRSNDGADG